MTEVMTKDMDNELMEFGNNVGRVCRFFNRKGFGFIKDLNDNKDYFVHNSEIILKGDGYRKLYPGEYVSYNIEDKDGKQLCTGVRGIMGYPLLTENEDHVYRVFPRNTGFSKDHTLREDTPRYQTKPDSDSGDTSDSESEEESTKGEEDPPKEEFINKEAPEGIEVADFDGLNINEEMG
jgi:cold shock CspA family protein